MPVNGNKADVATFVEVVVVDVGLCGNNNAVAQGAAVVDWINVDV